MKINTLLFAYYKKHMLFIGAAGHLIFILQTYKIFQAKSSRNVSLGGFIISFVSVLSWLIYGYLINDHVLCMVNIFGAISGFICLVTIIYYKV